MVNATNPFVVGRSIPNKFFCDRRKETAQLIEHMQNCRNTVLSSPRRLGKAALIHHVFQQPKIRKNFYCASFDALPTKSLQEFTFWLNNAVFTQISRGNSNLWKKFVDTIRSLQVNLSIDSQGSPSIGVSLGQIKRPEETILELFSYLDSLDKPVIIAIDEFQQIRKYKETNVEALLRSAAQSVKNVNLIYAGSRHHLINDIFMNANKPFYQSAVYLSLNPIDKDVYSKFVEQQFKAFSKKIDPVVISTVYDRYRGTTWFMQFVLNALFSIVGTNQTANLDLLEVATSNVIGFQDETFRQMITDLSAKEKALIHAVLKEGHVKSMFSADFINRNALESTSAVQANKRTLEDKGIIVEDDEGYRVFDFFFAQWLRNNLVL